MRRRSVTLSSGELVRSEPLYPDGALPLSIEPRQAGLDLVSWAEAHRSELEDRLLRHGGILLRGFGLRDAAHLEQLVAAVAGSTLEYKERSSPRSAVAGNIYTSTDYPAHERIFLHNENSYQQVWPLRIFFACSTAAESGGETPIADCRRIFERIEPAVRDRFLERGWMYVRNFGHGFGLDWRTVFQSGDREAVEAYCRRSGIEVDWLSGDRLRTRAVRPAAARHPLTGEPVWFNHATFFHVSTLSPTLREALQADFGDQDLPANTFYGDGSPIEDEVLDHLRAVYEAETIRFPWREGDVLVLDNMLVAHGREAFRGARKVLVGMARLVRRSDDACVTGLSEVEAA
jgi:alpha-ketoglutarate-dependent taurine dioxygenase